jgi:hypothetical protein
VSPTAPTFVTLNDQLNRAHRRIRELEVRETELLAHNRALRAAITALTHHDHPRTAVAVTSSSNDDSDGSGIGDHRGKHTSQRLGPQPQSQKPLVNPASAPASATGTTRVETRRFPYV